MKRKIIKLSCIIIAMGMLIFIGGCDNEDVPEKPYWWMLDEEMSETESNAISDDHVDSSQEVRDYIITIQIKQRHFNASDMIKDELNAITIDVPIPEEYFNTIKIGTVLNDSFRTGSLVMSRSVGTWDVKIIEKRIEYIE